MTVPHSTPAWLRHWKGCHKWGDPSSIPCTTKAWLHLFVIANGLILYTAPGRSRAGFDGKGGCVNVRSYQYIAIDFRIWAWFCGNVWKILGSWVCSNHIIVWSSQMHETITGHLGVSCEEKNTNSVFNQSQDQCEKLQGTSRSYIGQPKPWTDPCQVCNYFYPKNLLSKYV